MSGHVPLRVGDTFFMANTGGASNPSGAHLMVCMVAKTPEKNAIIVPIVSLRENSDESCVLNVGDHPFIKHPSCAAYDFVRAIPTAGVESDIASGEIVLQAPLSDDVLRRLQIGFINSDEVEPWAFDAAHGDKLRAHLKRKGHL